MYESLQKEICRSLSKLSDKERTVIELFFGIGCKQPLSLDEIGDSFNLTRERVRQIKEKGIKKLRTSSKSDLLKAYLG